MPRVTGPIASTTGDVLIGQVLADRYEIIKKLGEGGMGAVYMAVHMLLEKPVALKILHGEFARKDDLVERFIQEAKSASRIRHENVIDISDFGVTPDGLVFFAMELLQGHDLHVEVVRARKAGVPIPWERSRKIFLQICAALSAAHAQGIVHRDLKPENIYLVDFLGNKDFVKLLDFGIAKITDDSADGSGDRKLTKTGMLFGTPEYMSPEQARGEAIDHRVDIYAMGCILHQLITGRVPFEADNFMGILSMHLTEQLQPLAVDLFTDAGAPELVAAIIEKALAKNRDDRWQTIDEMANALRALHGEDLVEAAPVAVPLAASKPPGAGRSRTQWKGSPQVPLETMAGVPRPGAAKKSMLPLLAGVAVVGVAGGLIAYMALRTPVAAPTPGTVANTGVAGSAVAGSAAQTTLAPLPAQVTVALDTLPSGATVFQQLESGEWSKYGNTPMGIVGPGSRTPMRYRLVLAGHDDRIVAISMAHDGQVTEVMKPALMASGATVVPPTTATAATTTGTSTKPAGKVTGSTTSTGGTATIGDKPASTGDRPAGTGSKPAGTGAPEIKTVDWGKLEPTPIKTPDPSPIKSMTDPK